MNIILIVSDTFRYDNMFDRAAAMPVRTPALDRFHERAVSMSRFYTGSFPTIPQRTDMASGRIGWPWYGWQNLPLSTKNVLPQLLKDNGYITQLVCDCPHLFNSEFQKFFQGAVATRGQEGDKPMMRMNREIKSVMPPEKTRCSYFLGHPIPDVHRWTNLYMDREEQCFPPRTARKAVEFLEENYRHDPFFLWVDFFDPHEPWDPPEYMVRKYDPDCDGTPMIHPNYGKASDYTEAELRNLRAHYCAEAELVDRWVGRILEKIDDLDLWKNSVVVFTTDHGMSLGEHNRTGKSNINDKDDRFWPIYPEVAHIPFLAAAPGLDGGREVDIIGQPHDIVPTLFDLAGLKLATPEPVHGTSFAPHLRGEAAAPIHEFAIAASHARRTEDGKLGACAVTPVLYTETWAYAPVGPEADTQLFDTRNDYYCESDVASGNDAVVKELDATFRAWLKEMDAPESNAVLLPVVSP